MFYRPWRKILYVLKNRRVRHTVWILIRRISNMMPERKMEKYIGYCENDTAYYFACRTSEYILEVSKLAGKLKWIKSKIDADEPFYYDIAHGVLYEKEGYLELM